MDWSGRKVSGYAGSGLSRNNIVTAQASSCCSVMLGSVERARKIWQHLTAIKPQAVNMANLKIQYLIRN